VITVIIEFIKTKVIMNCNLITAMLLEDWVSLKHQNKQKRGQMSTKTAGFDDLLKFLKYDKETGAFTWTNTENIEYNTSRAPWRYEKHEGGNAINASGKIILNGKPIKASLLAFYKENGYVPKRVYFVDKDEKNIRIENLSETHPGFGGVGGYKKKGTIEAREEHEEEPEVIIKSRASLYTLSAQNKMLNRCFTVRHA